MTDLRETDGTDPIAAIRELQEHVVALETEVARLREIVDPSVDPLVAAHVAFEGKMAAKKLRR